MNTDPHGRAAKGLGCYVRAVAGALGVPDVGADYELDEPTTAYIALSQRTAEHRDLDLMLLWHEEHGWAVAVETRPSDPTIVLGYVGGRVLPLPAEVAASVHALLAGERAGQPEPPSFRHAGVRDDLDERLAAHLGAHVAWA